MSIGIISALHKKTLERAALQRDIDTFLKNGGRVTYIPPFQTTTDSPPVKRGYNGKIINT